MTRRVITAVVTVAAIIAVWSSVASAKFLPITDLRVTTNKPVTESPIGVVLRLSPDSGIGGPAVTHGEVVVLPADRVDAGGWPLDRTDGKPIVLREVRDGVFRGTFKVHRAGDYVVLARSSLYAHEYLAKKVHGVPDDLPQPIWLTITKQ